VAHLQQRFEVSERRACAVVGQSRSTQRYEAQTPDDEPALVARLLGLEEGTQAVFDLPAGEVFGAREPQMLQWVARKLLDTLGEPGADYAVGEVVEFPAPQGEGKVAGVVRELREDGAVLFDFNHPLAGQPVRFEVQLIGVL
jgi:FKBP-type peptidyl-prolyl cis-trans isomerase SlpA